MEEGALGAAEGEEQSPAQVLRGLVGFQGDGAGAVLPGVDVQVEDVVQGGQDVADLLCSGLGHQLYGSPAGKALFQARRGVAGHQLSMGQDEDGLAHRLHL